MPIPITSTAFMTNPQINPTFLENTFVILEKDYTQSDPFSTRYLTKNAVGKTIQCGLSKYAFDTETNRYSKLVDGGECFFIEIIKPTVDFDNSQCWLQGWVKAEDLTDIKTLSDEDLASRGF